MKEKQKIYGLLEFPDALYFSPDSLGKSVSVMIGGHSAKLILPSLPDWGEKEDDPLHKFLIGPKPADKWKHGNDLIFWGQPTSYPSGHSNVKFALLEFLIEDVSIDVASQAIYDAFPKWENLFHKYIMLLTKQNTWNKLYVGESPINLELLRINSDKINHISSNFQQYVSIEIGGVDVSIHYKQLVNVAKLSSKSLHPRLEYLLLLEAYIARRQHDYRKVIIEGASALEVSLTSKIQDEFDRLNILFGKKLLDKFRMLSGRFELARIIGIQFPDKDYDKLIFNKRNDVVHRASYPDKNSAEMFINEVEYLINLFSPQIYETT